MCANRNTIHISGRRSCCYVGHGHRWNRKNIWHETRWTQKRSWNLTTRRFTHKCLTNVEHKSAITNHGDRHNCVVDWEGAIMVDRETNRLGKKAIWIRKTVPTMNRDDGGYRLSHVWDSLLAMPSSQQWKFSHRRRPPIVADTSKWLKMIRCVIRNFIWINYTCTIISSI